MLSRNLQRRSPARRSRRGISVLWLIVIMPVALIGLLMTIETGRLWVARAEVEDALEAGALAGVIEWVQHPEDAPHSTLTARQVAAQFAASNTVLGQRFALSDAELNHRHGGNCNQNGSPHGVLVFGAITQIQPSVIFDPDADPHQPNYFYAVLARSAFELPSEYNIGGFTPGPYSVQAESVAMIDEEGRARIVRVDSIASP